MPQRICIHALEYASIRMRFAQIRRNACVSYPLSRQDEFGWFWWHTRNTKVYVPCLLFAVSRICVFVPHERLSHEDVYIEMGQSSHTQRGGAFVKTCVAATSKTNVVLSFLEAPEGDHKVWPLQLFEYTIRVYGVRRLRLRWWWD